MSLKYESISIPEGRTYSPPAKQAVVSLPTVRLVRSSQTVFQPFLQRGADNAASGHSLRSRLYVLPYQQYGEVAYCPHTPPPACENLPPAALAQR